MRGDHIEWQMPMGAPYRARPCRAAVRLLVLIMIWLVWDTSAAPRPSPAASPSHLGVHKSTVHKSMSMCTYAHGPCAHACMRTYMWPGVPRDTGQDRQLLQAYNRDRSEQAGTDHAAGTVNHHRFRIPFPRGIAPLQSHTHRTGPRLIEPLMCSGDDLH